MNSIPYLIVDQIEQSINEYNTIYYKSLIKYVDSDNIILNKTICSTTE